MRWVFIFILLLFAACTTHPSSPEKTGEGIILFASENIFCGWTEMAPSYYTITWSFYDGQRLRTIHTKTTCNDMTRIQEEMLKHHLESNGGVIGENLTFSERGDVITWVSLGNLTFNVTEGNYSPVSLKDEASNYIINPGEVFKNCVLLDEPARSDCIINLALFTGNRTLCDNVSTTVWEQNCAGNKFP